MAQPSSSHHERRGERERERHSSSHHHRTISSTTLLLTLSLILAVLAVLLSLPSTTANRARPLAQPPVVATDPEADPASNSLWGYLTPKRSHALISREGQVAQREAEVARREAELLVGAPGGLIPTPVSCPVCPTVTETIENFRPVQTVYKEVVKEESLAPPSWSNDLNRRIEEILDRESKIAEREKEIGRREEAVNRREHDASRRENWIMEQLVNLGEADVEEEFIYEPGPGKRKIKALPPLNAAPFPLTVTQYHTFTEASTRTQTITVPSPANTRPASPRPESMTSTSEPPSGPTTVVEYLVNEDDGRRKVKGKRTKRSKGWLPW